ncbi:MAG: biotin/lipoyl-binding protein, partial [Deltaproteobacteria bacterium]|nr:biotin/lipoyl-binding protein [Deltaproteobacteria bacterium]
MLPLLLALACSNGAPPPKSASLPVVVGEVSQGPATIRVTLDGEVLDAEEAEVGAEVAGTVLAVPARVGQSVSKGDEVILLDPRPFRIALEQADALRMAAEADVAVRSAALDRARASQLRV